MITCITASYVDEKNREALKLVNISEEGTFHFMLFKDSEKKKKFLLLF